MVHKVLGVFDRILLRLEGSFCRVHIAQIVRHERIRDVYRRSSDAVADLNRRQDNKLIHFSVERGTHAICWERISRSEIAGLTRRMANRKTIARAISDACSVPCGYLNVCKYLRRRLPRVNSV